MKTKEISSNEDILDVRDIIARYEQLADEHLELIGAVEAANQAHANGVHQDIVDANEALEDWNGDYGTEFNSLTELLEDLKGNGGDEQWKGDWYPITLIADSYFEDFARQEAEDIGLIKSDVSWPYTCIDWEKAADELKMDYTTVEFGGNTFWYR